MSEDTEETHATDLSANFYTHFQAKRSEITSQLDALDKSGSRSETQFAEVTSLSSETINLRKDLVDATPYLPSYDRGKCEQQLRVLEETLSRYKAPKAKFAFKRKPTSTTSHVPQLAISQVARHRVETPSVGTTAVSPTTNLTLSSRSSAYLTLSSLVSPPPDVSPTQPVSHPRSSDITLTDLKECIVNLLSFASPKDVLPGSGPTLTIIALHARDLSRVVLVMPSIEGSVLLHEIHNSIVIVGCHQFRMHNSTNTTVLLHVLSNPIIESSQGIRFGAYPVALCRTSPQSFSKRPSNHTMVQDFDWIKPTPSPHWSVVHSSSVEKKLVGVVDTGVDDSDVESVLMEVL